MVKFIFKLTKNIFEKLSENLSEQKHVLTSAVRQAEIVIINNNLTLLKTLRNSKLNIIHTEWLINLKSWKNIEFGNY